MGQAMNTSKVMEYFNASEKVTAPIHIIGTGAVGGYVAMALTQIGCDNIHLWDFDTVEPKNITNQVFRYSDIGKPKVEAVADLMRDKNPDIKITIHDKGIKAPYVVGGYVFLCVDNIDIRRAIVEANHYNQNTIAFFDFRMRLTDAQHYFAERANEDQVLALLSQMQFSHEEAKEATPMSACGVELSVVTTVWNIVALGVSNFIQYCMDAPAKTMVLSDMSTLGTCVFPI